MPEWPQEPGNEMTAAVDALIMQLATRVPLYRDTAGTWLVPLHLLLDTVELAFLLEATALTLFHPVWSKYSNQLSINAIPDQHTGYALAGRLIRSS